MTATRFALIFVSCILLHSLSARRAAAATAQDAAAYVEAIARINDAHLRQPGKNSEAQLGVQVPATAKSALKRVIEAKPSPEVTTTLSRCAEAALDLDLATDFEAIRAHLLAVAPEAAAKVGRIVSRPRFIARGIGEFQEGYLERFADVFDGILSGYDEVFGFKEFSKVPGKKLRIRVHLEPAITTPPHFAPEFPWHSEVDFPVIDPQQFSSPTPKGQFLFYGLCHELGHVIAMWGDLRTMEDHHSWAHYTGVTIVKHLAKTAKEKPWMQSLRDVRWRSLALERALTANQTPPSRKDAAGVMSLLLSLHDAVGPKTIGAALNRLDEQRKNTRINQVRYYRFVDLRKALEEVAPEPDKRAAIAKAFGK